MQGSIYHREALGTPRHLARWAFLRLLMEYYSEVLFDEPIDGLHRIPVNSLH